MDFYNVVRTTFAARDFTDEPVSDATLARILDNARFALPAVVIVRVGRWLWCAMMPPERGWVS